jgi:thiol-disulfide isomerase/thioredoxin
MRTVLACLLALCCAPALAALKVGDLPPPEVGTDVADKPVSLGAFKGKVVVVTFWASWCGPCLNEMSMLAKLQRVAGHQALEVVAVNFREDITRWRALKKALATLDLRITRDGDWSVSKAYDVQRIPHMFMLDKSGRIARIHVGYDEKALDTILKEINELLAQPGG